MLSMLRFSTKKEFLHGFAALSEFGRGTLNAFDQYIEDGVDFEIHRSGVLMAFSSQAELDSHAIEFEGVESYGLKPVKVLTGDEMRSREPLLSSFVSQGIDCHDQYFLDPSSFIQGLRRECEKLGVTFIETDSEIKLRAETLKARVYLGDSMIDSQNIVIAAGAQSRELLAQVKVKCPVRFGKGYCFDFVGEKRINSALYLSGAKIAVTPNSNYLRFAGTMEFGGNESKVDLKRARGILSNSAEYFTEDLTQDVAPKVGLRPMTPDGLPVIGKVGDISNLYIASGHAMQGVTLAPNTGKVMAQLLLRKESEIDISSFSPNRFN
jgi:D-amino-acid dehydrogenase